jgi:hypothetical protein
MRGKKKARSESGITNISKTTLGLAPSGRQFPPTQVSKARAILKQPP